MCTSQLCGFSKQDKKGFLGLGLHETVYVYAPHMWYSLLQRPEEALRKFSTCCCGISVLPGSINSSYVFLHGFFENWLSMSWWGAKWYCLHSEKLFSTDHLLIIQMAFSFEVNKKRIIAIDPSNFWLVQWMIHLWIIYFNEC